LKGSTKCHMDKAPSSVIVNFQSTWDTEDSKFLQKKSLNFKQKIRITAAPNFSMGQWEVKRQWSNSGCSHL
jgi:hypothetical protein